MASNAASVNVDKALAAKMASLETPSAGPLPVAVDDAAAAASRRLLALLDNGGAAADVAAAVAAVTGGFAALAQQGVLVAISSALGEVKNVPRRQAALDALVALVNGPECKPAEPWVLARLPVILEALADRADGVRKAAEAVVEAFSREVSSDATTLLLPLLFESIHYKKKWQTRVGALNILGGRARVAAPQVAANLPEILPHLTEAAHDSRTEVVKAAELALADVTQHDVVGNRDLDAFVPALLSCLARPSETAETVHKLSATTFVQRVEPPALALMVPVLEYGLRERATAVKRRCCVIIENMVKLVSEPADAAPFVPKLLPGLERAKNEVSDPECRAVANRAYAVLLSAAGVVAAAAGADGYASSDPGSPSSSGQVTPRGGTPAPAAKAAATKASGSKGKGGKGSSSPATPSTPVETDIASINAETFLAMPGAAAAMRALRQAWRTTVTGVQLPAEASANSGATSPLEAVMTLSLAYVAALAGSRASAQSYSRDGWAEAVVLPYLGTYLQSVSHAVREALAAAFVDLVYADTHGGAHLGVDEADEGGEDICNVEFSLAYGGKTLLNSARLHLRRGHRYGLCGANGCGKSTLLRAISSGQLDGFPSPEEVRTVYVEHDIQGSLADYPCLDYIWADGNKFLATVTRDEAVAAFQLLGFTEEMQKAPVTALSGGWRMKLALARAMLLRADILLLDEPTNHLDTTNVKWLQNYLNTQCNNVTAIMVSHDSGFLDTVCTDIIHYQNFKLTRYRGNLQAFVHAVPSAASYYDVTATPFTFRLPEPGYLEGVRDRSKPILKMVGATFAYPGTERPIFSDVRAVCSLSSRVGVVGPNGAGKSTLIKCLTGELVPISGSVIKHPNLRVAYVAQHAFHHIEKHLDKTPSEYIQWRFATGEDREAVDKAANQVTEDEEKKMAEKIVIDGSKYIVERLLARRKLRNSYEYEVAWVGLSPDRNKWMPRSWLEAQGFGKMVDGIDAREAAAAGLHSKQLTAAVISQHLADVGLESEFTLHHRMRGLSGGQRLKVVLGACTWMNPHLVVLDEPTNFLDRDSLGALIGALKEFGGGVLAISHNDEFIKAVCKERWNVGNGMVRVEGESWSSPLELKGAAAAQAAGGSLNPGEVMDAAGNVIKVKEKSKKKMTVSQRKAYLKERQARIDRGEDVSDSDEDM